MATIEEKKKFALEQIKPYVKDRSLCGVDETGHCCYLTKKGKMCVAGKNMIDPRVFEYDSTAVYHILSEHGEVNVLKPESRNILDASEWSYLQNIHDHLAESPTFRNLDELCKALGLFTYEELMS